MRVADQDRTADRLAGCLTLQRQAQLTDAAPGVENDELAARADLDTRGIAAVATCLRSRGREGAPDSPELASHGPPMRCKFWGVRGSLPSPGPETCRYGGNTSCVEIRAGGELIILDAGSGIRKLGLALQREAAGQPIRGSILISHTHWDHIHGLPFFAPAFVLGNHFTIYGCAGSTLSL